MRTAIGADGDEAGDMECAVSGGSGAASGAGSCVGAGRGTGMDTTGDASWAGGSGVASSTVVRFDRTDRLRAVCVTLGCRAGDARRCSSTANRTSGPAPPVLINVVPNHARVSTSSAKAPSGTFDALVHALNRSVVAGSGVAAAVSLEASSTRMTSARDGSSIGSTSGTPRPRSDAACSR